MIRIIRAFFVPVFLLLVIAGGVPAFGQKDSKPTITGQTPSPLTTNQGTPITIELSNLIVTDPDPQPVYPAGFSLEVSNGKDYKANGNTVTPDAGFSGMLTVDVRVSDGKNKSDKFGLQINVIKTQNEAPVITGQKPLTIDQGSSVTIEFANLTVKDPDNAYPTGFNLTVYAGKDYTFNGTTVTPEAKFSGKLTVPVTVNDGKNESNRFDLKIDVKKKKNVAPEITGQQALSMNQGASLTIVLGNLIVTDPDNTYPGGFTLKVYGGKDYTFSGTTITPSPNFTGELKVPVTVNDGEQDSKRFDLKIDVNPKANVAPQITGQQPLNVGQGGTLTVNLNNLIVADPDNAYPTGFTLKLFGGPNYTFNGAVVTPAANFSGQLTVPVTVNDGTNESNRFDLKIDVNPEANVAPQITGQQPISIAQGGVHTITLANLIVTDPRDAYPAGFTLKVYPGSNYSFSATTITPLAAFTGQLIVPVTVNDGEHESNPFDLKINVLAPGNVAPEITGQQALTINQGSSLTVVLTHLTVIDPDNTYPNGFTLQVGAGTSYAVSDNTITPAADFTGVLTAPVTVNDGTNASNSFALKIEVLTTPNIAPEITGQINLTVNEDNAITIALTSLTVKDPDNTYPQGFTIAAAPGTNYTVSGLTITPAKDYSGELTVPVVVSDGISDSAPFNLKITVAAVNDAPVITGQNFLTTNKNTLLTIPLSALTVTDPDNKYPDDFKLKILSGEHYSIAGDLINPAIGFVGTLTVPVMVNDGKSNSPAFDVKVNVVAPGNVAPTIIGQRPVSTAQGVAVTIQLSQLLVEDPDNSYPQGFSLKVFPGSDYTVTGNVVTPSTSIASGTFPVMLTVSDGQDNSAPFQMKIQIVAPTAKPRIISQRELIMPEDSTLTIRLTDIVVTDADDPDYPTGFTLIVTPARDGTYARNGNAVTPAQDLNGFIEVGVMVSDGVNASEEFKVAILITPVNDPPEFVRADTTTLAYDPSQEPLNVFELIQIRDVDDDHLVLAEVGFEGDNYSVANDQCQLSVEQPSIRPVIDASGRLFLIGYATVDEYIKAVQSLQYAYVISEDVNGNSMDILRGPRTITLTVSDGHLASSTTSRKISMELDISLKIPNAFSPNGDRVNDTWHIDLLHADKVDGARLRVFDKGGALVYETVGLEKEWDGSFNGRMLPVDTYYYTIDLDLSFTRKSYKGTVVVLY